jgi:hypothetical protein
MERVKARAAGRILSGKGKGVEKWGQSPISL